MRITAISVLLAGCQPQVCGLLRVGGGELQLTLEPESGEPLTLSVDGAEALRPGDVPEGAWLELGPTPGDGTAVYVTAEVPEAQVPCGMERARLELAVFERSGFDTGGRFVEGQLRLLNLTGAAPDARAGPPALTLFLSSFYGQPSPFEATTRIAGRARIPGNLEVLPGPCEGELTFGPAEVRLEWAFDPEQTWDGYRASAVGACDVEPVLRFEPSGPLP